MAKEKEFGRDNDSPDNYTFIFPKEVREPFEEICISQQRSIAGQLRYLVDRCILENKPLIKK